MRELKVPVTGALKVDSAPNGRMKVQLAGSSWQGEGFDVSTVNGGVTIQTPAEYSARLAA